MNAPKIFKEGRYFRIRMNNKPRGYIRASMREDSKCFSYAYGSTDLFPYLNDYKEKYNSTHKPKDFTDEEIDKLENKWRIEYFEDGVWVADLDYPFKDGAEADAKTFAEGRKWRVVKI